MPLLIDLTTLQEPKEVAFVFEDLPTS